MWAGQAHWWVLGLPAGAASPAKAPGVGGAERPPRNKHTPGTARQAVGARTKPMRESGAASCRREMGAGSACRREGKAKIKKEPGRESGAASCRREMGAGSACRREGKAKIKKEPGRESGAASCRREMGAGSACRSQRQATCARAFSLDPKEVRSRNGCRLSLPPRIASRLSPIRSYLSNQMPSPREKNLNKKPSPERELRPGSAWWWRRGELNPCPKTSPYVFLRAQFTVFALRQLPFAAHRQTGAPHR